MSHFSTILENLRLVAIKRSPIAQQKQQQTQSQQTQQQPQCPVVAAINDTTKVCDGVNGQPIASDFKINNDTKQIKGFINHQQTPTTTPTKSSSNTNNNAVTSNATTTTPSHHVNHHNATSEDVVDRVSSTASASNTPVRHHHSHKRQSVSARGSIGSADAARNSPGRERSSNRGSTNVIVEIDSSGGGGGSTGGGGGSGSGKNTSTSRGSRELSPTPKNQQRKMSTTDFRARAGSFIHVDEEGRSILMRKPVRLKNIEGRPEVYDTLHFKGREVSGGHEEETENNTCLFWVFKCYGFGCL